MKEKPTKPTRAMAREAIRTLIKFIGDDPDREGLLRTPERVIHAWEEAWGRGYSDEYIGNQLHSIQQGQFADGAEHYNAMILVRKIHFESHCEHHMAPFFGTADVAYIPSDNGPILGLSKLAHIVEMFSRRLQVQERLNTEIADFLMRECKPLGVGVVLRAVHSCMSSRGVRQPEAETVTSILRGVIYKDARARSEFLNLVR